MKIILIITILFFAIEINAQQYVGINTTTPSNSLSVKGTLDVSDSIGVGIEKPKAPLQFKNEFTNRKLVLFDVNLTTPNQHEFYGFGVNTNTLRYQSAGSHTFYSSIDANNSREVFRINGAGNVNMQGNLGIGTGATPIEKFYVNGTAKVESDFLVGGNVLFAQRLNILDKLAIGTGSTSVEKFYVNGDAKIETNLLVNDKLNVINRVAIGASTTPVQKLYVNGDAKIETNLTVAGSSTIVGDANMTGNAYVTNNLNVGGRINMGTTFVFTDFTLNPSLTVNLSASCPVNTQLLSGGGGNYIFNSGTDEVFLNYNGPDPNDPLKTWKIYARNTGSVARTIRIYCICARIN